MMLTVCGPEKIDRLFTVTIRPVTGIVSIRFRQLSSCGKNRLPSVHPVEQK